MPTKIFVNIQHVVIMSAITTGIISTHNPLITLLLLYCFFLRIIAPAGGSNSAGSCPNHFPNTVGQTQPKLNLKLALKMKRAPVTLNYIHLIPLNVKCIITTKVHNGHTDPHLVIREELRYN